MMEAHKESTVNSPFKKQGKKTRKKNGKGKEGTVCGKGKKEGTKKNERCAEAQTMQVSTS